MLRPPVEIGRGSTFLEQMVLDNIQSFSNVIVNGYADCEGSCQNNIKSF